MVGTRGLPLPLLLLPLLPLPLLALLPLLPLLLPEPLIEGAVLRVRREVALEHEAHRVALD